MNHKLYIIGIGPGAYDLLTIRAERILKDIVGEIVGYKTYVNFIKPYFPGKIYKEFGMGEELARISYAVETVLFHDRDVALISGGDPTVYGMVSPFLEYIIKNNISLSFEIIPGVTSVLAASPRLGAPIANDFSILSLSDYLISWKEIVERLKNVLLTGMEVILYNPVSRNGKEKIETVKDLILKIRGPHTKVGIVENAERKDEKVEIVEAHSLSFNSLSMRSIIFISDEKSIYKKGYLFTPRGYKIE